MATELTDAELADEVDEALIDDAEPNLGGDVDLADPTNSRIVPRPTSVNRPDLPVMTIVDDSPGFDPGDSGPQGAVKKDEQGRVTEVAYLDGDVRQFGYGTDGQLNRVVQPDGKVLVLLDGKWQYEAGDTKSRTDMGSGELGSLPGFKREPDFANPRVSSDGTFTFEQKDGSKTQIYNDGSSTRFNANGSTVFANADEQVTSVRYANGDLRSFTYDDQGKVASVSENGKKYTVNGDELYGPDDKPTGLRTPTVAADGSFSSLDTQGSYVTVFTDRTSSTAKLDGSFVRKNADGQVTEVAYPGGQKQKFVYDENGQLTSITDQHGKTYQSAEGAVFRSDDGSTRTDVQVKSDGTLVYQDADGKIHTEFTTGNSTKTMMTAEEIRQAAKLVNAETGLLSDGEAIKTMLSGLSTADVIALDEQYKALYGVSLTDKLKSQAWNPYKEDNVNAALAVLTDAQLRNGVIQNFSDPEEIEAAFKDINEFQLRAQQQGLTVEQLVMIQDKAAKELAAGGYSSDQLLEELEKTLTDLAPTSDSLNTKYGVKYDEVVGADGSKKRQYYVEGEEGAKLPVLETNSDDPVEIERRLKEWQDKKISELEQKYNVEFSRDGQTDAPLGKTVDLRSPRVDELVALEEGLRLSEPSTSTVNGRPILVQFAIQPSSPYDAYVLDRDGQQRILFEPLDRDYSGLKDTILHEWAHNAEHSVGQRDPAALAAFYESIGFRTVKIKDSNGNDGEQWQIRDREGNYYAQGPGQAPFGTWTRVDAKGQPLRADGTPATGFDDRNAVKVSNHDMMNIAAVRPASNYFATGGEAGAESLRYFRADEEARAELYGIDPVLYAATKEFDQQDLDNDPKYGTNPDSTSKYIRMPDGSIAVNDVDNQKVVADFEAGLQAIAEEKYYALR